MLLQHGDIFAWKRVRLMGYEVPKFLCRAARQVPERQVAWHMPVGMIARTKITELVISLERNRYVRSLAALVLDNLFGMPLGPVPRLSRRT